MYVCIFYFAAAKKYNMDLLNTVTLLSLFLNRHLKYYFNSIFCIYFVGADLAGSGIKDQVDVWSYFAHSNNHFIKKNNTINSCTFVKTEKEKQEQDRTGLKR